MKKSTKTLINLTISQRKNLEASRRYHAKGTYKKDKKILQKIDVILLRNGKYSVEAITTKTNLKKRTVYNYLKKYKEVNGSMYNYLKSEYPKSDLFDFEKEIRKEFEIRPIKTYEEAALRIEAITGIKRSIPQIIEFLDQLGIYTKYKRNIDYMNARRLKSKTILMELEDNLTEIIRYFSENIPKNYDIATKELQRIANVKISKTKAIEFLNDHGIYSVHSLQKKFPHL